jgi:hypothetical protein
VGDNELSEFAENVRTGSHTVVMGQENNFSHFGGSVVGLWNKISGDFALVSGGAFTTASGFAASVTSGRDNTASGAAARTHATDEGLLRIPQYLRAIGLP